MDGMLLLPSWMRDRNLTRWERLIDSTNCFGGAIMGLAETTPIIVALSHAYRPN